MFHESLWHGALRGVALALALLWSQLSFGHGGVVAEEDLCLLKMGFLQAHFTLYLPDTRGSEEFCEEVPDTGRALFVVEYLHEMMKEMPIEFRIVRDDQGFGIFANRPVVGTFSSAPGPSVLRQALASSSRLWTASTAPANSFSSHGHCLRSYPFPSG